MLRGFRWQLLVLFMALGLFIVSLLSRSSNPETPPPETPVPQSTATQAELIPTSTPEAVQAIAPVQVTSDQPISTYREALIGTVQRLNPLLTDLNPVDRDITALIFEGLTRTNQYGEAEPDLAKSWVISSDGLE